MKTFIEKNGIFQLEYPNRWYYELQDGIHKIECIDQFAGVFQLSIINSNNNLNIKKKFDVKGNKDIFTENINGIKYIKLPTSQKDDYFSEKWLFKIDGISFLATYTYKIDIFNDSNFKQNINSIKKIVYSVRVIPDQERKEAMAWNCLSRFVAGVAASQQILNKALKNGSFIEIVCIIANQIDALLRIGLILNYQIKNKCLAINPQLLYQAEGDKVLFERDIYIKALNDGIINEAIFKALNEKYSERNKVIHRYIISELKTADILTISQNYLDLREKINSIIKELENSQILQKVGMTAEAMNISELDGLSEDVNEKHGLKINPQNN